LGFTDLDLAAAFFALDFDFDVFDFDVFDFDVFDFDAFALDLVFLADLVAFRAAMDASSEYE
jgi:hypothetical protein